MESILAELSYELKKLGLSVDANKVKSSNNLWIKAAAEDLMSNRGDSIILGGSQLSPEFHQLIALLNNQLKNISTKNNLLKNNINKTNFDLSKEKKLNKQI